MNNDKCLLVEFVNENNSIAVGFREWLTIKYDDEMLQELVDKGNSIPISWPSCEIKSAMKMKKIVKTLTAKDWTMTVIKVLAFGEWTDMHRQLSEIEKFDIKNPCKDERKKLMKKSFIDHELDDEYNQCTKKRKTESKINKRSKMTKVGTLMQQQMLSDIKGQTSCIKNWCISSDEDETISSNENYKPSNKKEKINMNAAQQQQESLIAKSQSVLKKWREVEDVADRVMQKLQSIENLTKDVRIVHSDYLMQQSEKDTSINKNNDHDVILCNNEDILQKVKIDTDVIINIASPTQNSHIVNDTASVKEEVNIETDVTVDIPSPVERPQSVINDIYVDKNMVSLGQGVNIPSSIMRKIRTSDIGKMTCDLMSHLFSTQEIACSSRTGKKNNIKLENSIERKKKPLDQDYKFNAMKDYVLLNFKNVNNAEQLFNTAVTNKCKNVARNFKKLSTSEKSVSV